MTVSLVTGRDRQPLVRATGLQESVTVAGDSTLEEWKSGKVLFVVIPVCIASSSPPLLLFSSQTQLRHSTGIRVGENTEMLFTVQNLHHDHLHQLHHHHHHQTHTPKRK
jgi:hypothetical protein